MSNRESVSLEFGFVLHQMPYRNSSQLLECFTVNHGRVGLVAHGSRRTRSGSRAVLQAFLPLKLSWIKRGELGRLTHVEAHSSIGVLAGRSLLAGYYANELVLKLLERDDENGAAFRCYRACLEALTDGEHVARTLRRFEFALLNALGYGLDLTHDASGAELVPEHRYCIGPEGGLQASDGSTGYLGSELSALSDMRLDDERSLTAARRLLAQSLDAHLHGRRMRSRDVLRDIVDLGLDI